MEDNNFELGNHAFDNGDFKSAIQYYQMELKDTSNPDPVIFNLALAYYEVKDYQKSIEYASKITKKPSIYSKDALFTKANCYHALKDYEEAEDVFSSIIYFYPNESSAYFNRANAREKLNNAEGAEEDRRMCELLEGQKDNNYYQAPKLKDIQDYSLDKFNLEKERLLKNINDQPDSYSLYYELGNAYVKIREFHKALKYFHTAVEKYTGKYYANAKQNIMAIYFDLKDYPKVINCANEFLQKNPNHEKVLEMKQFAEEALGEEKSSKKQDRIPTLTIVSGGVCTGKSTHINKKYFRNNHYIDAGELFIGLSSGEYYDFPSVLEDEINEMGLTLFKIAIKNKEDIVIEVIGSDKGIMEQFIELAKSIKYTVKLEHLTCDIETAKNRNNNRGDDSISAYYTESYHLKWFKQAVIDYLSESVS